MLKPLVPIVVCALAGVAHASGVDDALAAVQHASEDGASCKGLATKLKLATEALEQARKAPSSHGTLQQAKGRVEVAKDFASTACADAAKAKVTEELATALAAIEKAGEPAKVEHQGAAFGAVCRENDACASEHCYVGAAADGYCTKVCTAVSECPAQWQCRRLGSAPEKICTK